MQMLIMNQSSLEHVVITAIHLVSTVSANKTPHPAADVSRWEEYVAQKQNTITWPLASTVTWQVS